MPKDLIVIGSAIVMISLVTLIFDRFKKGKKLEYFINNLVCVAISGFLFAMSIPDFRSIRVPRNTAGKSCISNQRQLLAAIEMYQANEHVIISDNLNDEELIKLQNDYLIKNKYIKEAIIKPSTYNKCIYKIKDSTIYCLEHGSCDFDSPLYTEGFPTYDNGKAKKEFEENVEKAQKKSDEKRSHEKISLIIAFISLIPVIKYSIFFFMSLG